MQQKDVATVAQSFSYTEDSEYHGLIFLKIYYMTDLAAAENVNVSCEECL